MMAKTIVTRGPVPAAGKNAKTPTTGFSGRTLGAMLKARPGR